MVSLALSSQAPPDWDECCGNGRYLFHSLAWQTLLGDSFRCSTAYAWNSQEKCGAAMTLFRAGPFHVAYAGFPVGAFIGDAPAASDIADSWRSQSAVPCPACVRIPVSSLDQDTSFDLPVTLTPETAISDLPGWGLAQTSSNIRRDIKKADRAGLEIVEAGDSPAADAIFELYRTTVERNRGSIRYPRAYFENLVQFSQRDSRVRVLLAKKDDKIAAFNVAALDDGTGYYLHGGIDQAARDSRPGAKLMHESILWAQRSECSAFNLLSSPAKQPSLVQYKEKWGAETRDHRTYTIAIAASYPLFRAAESLYRMIS